MGSENGTPWFIFLFFTSDMSKTYLPATWREVKASTNLPLLILPQRTETFWESVLITLFLDFLLSFPKLGMLACQTLSVGHWKRRFQNKPVCQEDWLHPSHVLKWVVRLTCVPDMVNYWLWLWWTRFWQSSHGVSPDMGPIMAFACLQMLYRPIRSGYSIHSSSVPIQWVSFYSQFVLLLLASEFPYFISHVQNPLPVSTFESAFSKPFSSSKFCYFLHTPWAHLEGYTVSLGT